MSDSKLIAWSTLTFLGALLLVMLGSTFWTGSYWAGNSMMAEGFRAKDGYLGGIFQLIGGGGEIPFASRMHLLLFVSAPILCGLLALLAAALVALELRGRSMKPFACGLAGLVLLGTYLGLKTLHQMEDQVFYDRSPWVSTFKTMAYPLALFAQAYLLFLAGLWIRKKSRPARRP